ncbi:MAG: hypothetical protein ACRD1R_05300 [Acidobacteriota bacterium]
MRKELLLLVAVLIVLLMAPAVQAADGPDLSGTWVLDKEKSDPIRMGFGRGRGPGGGQDSSPPDIDVTLSISQSENQLMLTRKFNMDGRERTQEQTFTLDGEENINPGLMGRGELTSKSQWKESKLVIEGFQVVSTPNGEFEIGSIEEYSLSEDGKVLTLRATRATPRGEQSSTQVFNKQ